MKIYIVRHGQVPHNALHQYNTVDVNKIYMDLFEKLGDK